MAITVEELITTLQRFKKNRKVVLSTLGDYPDVHIGEEDDFNAQDLQVVDSDNSDDPVRLFLGSHLLYQNQDETSI